MGKGAKRIVRVFIASPGDLQEERRAFKEVIEGLNPGFGDGCDVEFEPLGWEDTLLPAGIRPQDIINQEIQSCEIFLLVLWWRWGQKPKGSKYSSYTEEEFELARALHSSKNTRPIIYVFIKDVPPQAIADPGPQLRKLLEFRRKLQDKYNIVARRFADVKGFRELLDVHLRGSVKPDGPLARVQAKLLSIETQPVLIAELKAEMKMLQDKVKHLEKPGPQSEGQEQQKKSRAAVDRAVKDTEADLLSVQLAERASKAARAGNIESARQDFALAASGSRNLRVLYLTADFYLRMGDLETAEQTSRRMLAIVGESDQNAATADAYNCLGHINDIRGQLKKAERFYSEALGINIKLNRLKEQAANLGNLGLIAQARGKLDLAETFHRKSLAIERKLKHLEGQADDLGNLGLLYQERGKFNEAEKFHRASLRIERKLGHLRGQAADLGNLGVVYQAKGQLDKAEKYHRESLAIEHKLNRLEGQANQLGNLGSIYQARGKLGEAEKYHRRSLEIERKLGHLEGQANDLDNLAQIYQIRGDIKAACEHFRQAYGLYKRIGIKADQKLIEQRLRKLGCKKA